MPTTLFSTTTHTYNLFLLSYGSRGEIVNACRKVSAQVQAGTLGITEITEQTFSAALSTADCPGKKMRSK